MKKYIFFLLLLLTISLSSCDTAIEVVDCDKYPSHVDCLTDPDPDPDPITCETGFELVGDKCEEIEILTCETGFEVVGDKCEAIVVEDFLEIYYLNDLQGSALSNYYNGLSTINMLNLMGLDAFVVGNHEFDWGLDTILNYQDGNLDNGEADFPFLAANIVYKGTDDMPEEIDPYTIITKGTHKIGVIGTIGYGLEGSIAESKVSPYEFLDPMPFIEQYATYLRTVENCDVIIVVAHDSGRINDDVAALTGDAKVDAVFNGHSHSTYANMNNGIPEIQSGSNGKNVGYVKMTFDDVGDISYDIDNLTKYSDALFHTEDTDVQALLDTYLLETDDLFNTPIFNSENAVSKGELTDWISELINKSVGADISFHNYGGTRTDIEDSESISLGLLYQIWPFDNVIKTSVLTGTEVNALIASGSLGYYTDITYFDPSELYLVATNDYVYDKPTNPFLDGLDPTNTGLLLRDLALTEMEKQALIYDTFDVDNEIVTTYQDYAYLLEETAN